MSKCKCKNCRRPLLDATGQTVDEMAADQGVLEPARRNVPAKNAARRSLRSHSEATACCATTLRYPMR